MLARYSCLVRPVRPYRAIYTVKLADIVYVLHVFQKKSTRGIATPKREIAVIKERWQRAKRHYAAHYGA
ncbi:MAG: type II toxin-antitoxin system RelE/ParE family toxin [Gemmatimonadota bacterium]